MKRQFSYKTRLKFLLAGAVLLLIACYKLSFVKAFEQYNEYKKSNNLNIENLGYKTDMAAFNANSNFIDNIYRKYSIDSYSIDKADSLLLYIDSYCKMNGIVLKEYKPYPVSEKEGLKIYTRLFTLQSGFVDCVKLLYELETNYTPGRVSSVSFKKTMANDGADEELACSIYIQNIITNEKN